MNLCDEHKRNESCTMDRCACKQANKQFCFSSSLFIRTFQSLCLSIRVSSCVSYVQCYRNGGLQCEGESSGYRTHLCLILFFSYAHSRLFNERIADRIHLDTCINALTLIHQHTCTCTRTHANIIVRNKEHEAFFSSLDIRQRCVHILKSVFVAILSY